MKIIWFLIITIIMATLSPTVNSASRSLDPMEIPQLVSDLNSNPRYLTERQIPIKEANTLDRTIVPPYSIDNNDLRNNSVTEDKMANASISTNKIQYQAVTSDKLDQYQIKNGKVYLEPADVVALTSTPFHLFYGIPTMIVLTHGNPGAAYPGAAPTGYAGVGSSDKLQVFSTDTLGTDLAWGTVNMVGFLDSADNRCVLYPPTGQYTPVPIVPFVFMLKNPGDGITLSEGQRLTVDFWYVSAFHQASDIN